MTNIVTISVDDLFNVPKFRDVFGVEIQTPNMDRLAAMGVTYNNAYATVALCNPSRTSIVTGQSPSQTGVHNNNQPWGDHISPAETIFPMIRDAGYETALFGKVMHRMNADQVSQMFDIAKPTVNHDPSMVKNTVAYLANPPAGPFVLSVGLHDPHAPFDAGQVYRDLYPLADIVVPPNVGDEISPFIQAFLGGGIREGTLEETIQHYLANISQMDANLGIILDAIEASGTNPAIVFYSDHGFSLGDHEGYVGKFNLWEQSANSPLIVVQPGGPHGVVVDTPISFLDIAPTILALAGLTPTSAMTGQSLLGTIEDRPVMTEMEGSYSIRVGEWRYTHYVDGTVEVFNVMTDPGCYDNLHGEAATATVEGVLALTLADLLASEGVVQMTGLTVHEGPDGATEYYVQSQAALDAYSLDTGGHDIIFGLTDHITMSPGIEDYFNDFRGLTVTGNSLNNNIHGASTVFGKAGSDTITGSGDLHGGLGRDHLTGGDKIDHLFGDRSNDVLVAKGGNDVLNGGRGNDWLTGGLGHDTFVFGNSPGFDSVADFLKGTDHLQFVGIDPTTVTVSDHGADAWVTYGGETVVVSHGVGLALSDLEFLA